MAVEDRERWDKKYENNHPIPTKIVKVLEEYFTLAEGVDALDIACGMGRNSRFLAKHGFNVDALDISPVALKSLENIAKINAEEVDFDSYRLKENCYDLIVSTYYLNRTLFPQIKKALRENGVFIFETFMHHPENTKVPSNRSFLLEQGELEKIFSKGYEILYSNEFMGEVNGGDKAMRASIVVRKS